MNCNASAVLGRVTHRRADVGHKRLVMVLCLSAGLSVTMLLALGMQPSPGPGMPPYTALSPAPALAAAKAAPAEPNEVVSSQLPANRVRPAPQVGDVPQPFYLHNRVVFRSVRVTSDGDGMRVSGEILVDFDCDRPPAGSGLETGQIRNLSMQIALYDHTTILELERGQVRMPSMAALPLGQPVPGQTASTATRGTVDGFGHAVFELPALSRPLAPGIYGLTATLSFASQGQVQQEQIKWCSGFWGAEDLGMVDGVRETRDILSNPELHRRYWRDVVEVARVVRDQSVLVVADTRTKDKVVVRGPERANDRNPPTMMVWTRHLDAIAEQEVYEQQREQVAADRRRGVIDAAEAKRLLDSIRQLSDRGGGPASAAELKLLASHVAARDLLLASLHAFQDQMKFAVWVLADGILRYTGFFSIDQPGLQAWHAIDKNDATAARESRLKRREGVDAAVLAQRDAAGKLQPPEIWRCYTDFLRCRDDVPDFDPVNFTTRKDGKLVLNVAAWARHRQGQQQKLSKQAEPWFDLIDTSRHFANRLFPALVAEVAGARDQALALGYAYEYSIRTRLQNESREDIDVDWRLFAADDTELARVMDLARVDREAVKTRFDGNIMMARKLCRLEDYRARWGAALRDGKPLPGKATK